MLRRRSKLGLASSARRLSVLALTKLAAKDSPILRPSHRFAAAQERLAAEAHPREQAPPWVRTHVRAVHLRPRGLVLVQRSREETKRFGGDEQLVVEARYAVAP